MKRLNSKKMRDLLRSGKRKARGRPPADGSVKSLIYRTDRNGWHYQVEWIHDTRCNETPYIIVYAFKPPKDFSARSATHYLTDAK